MAVGQGGEIVLHGSSSCGCKKGFPQRESHRCRKSALDELDGLHLDPTPEYYSSIIRWQETRNDVTGLTAEAIGYENGVLGGVISALNCVCSRGDKVLVHSPTYIGFTRCLTDNGYAIVHSPLVQDENGIWRMDYADMEKHLAEEHIHAAILCSPHNPCGRVWTKEELERIGRICNENHVLGGGRRDSSRPDHAGPYALCVRLPFPGNGAELPGADRALQDLQPGRTADLQYFCSQ